MVSSHDIRLFLYPNWQAWLGCPKMTMCVYNMFVHMTLRWTVMHLLGSFHMGTLGSKAVLYLVTAHWAVTSNCCKIAFTVKMMD